MDNWDDLRFLVAMARAGTMKAAAQMLGTNTATVSRRIDRLSDRLGEPAFVKTPEGWKPSAAAASLIQVAQSFDGQIQTALHSASVEGSAPVTVRLGCIPFVVRHLLIPGMVEHEDLLEGVNLVFTDRLFKDGLGDHDLVIQVERPENGRLVTRKIATLPLRFYRPKPCRDETQWVGFTEVLEDMPLQRFGLEHFGCPPRVRMDSLDAIHSVIKSLGIAGPMADLMAANDPDLEPLSPESAFHYDFWLIYHETRRNDPVIRSTVEFVTRCFEGAVEGSINSRAAE